MTRDIEELRVAPFDQHLGPIVHTFKGSPESFSQNLMEDLRPANAQTHMDSQGRIIIDYFDKLFRHCRAQVCIRKGSEHCAEIARLSGDTFSFARLVQRIRGTQEEHVPELPLCWGAAEVEIAGSMLASEAKEQRSEGLAMLLRYHIYPEELAQRALELLADEIEVCFLAARLLREMAARGLLRSGASMIRRALPEAKPLAARELVAALGSLR